MNGPAVVRRTDAANARSGWGGDPAAGQTSVSIISCRRKEMRPWSISASSSFASTLTGNTSARLCFDLTAETQSSINSQYTLSTSLALSPASATRYADGRSPTTIQSRFSKEPSIVFSNIARKTHTMPGTPSTYEILVTAGHHEKDVIYVRASSSALRTRFRSSSSNPSAK